MLRRHTFFARGGVLIRINLEEGSGVALNPLRLHSNSEGTIKSHSTSPLFNSSTQLHPSTQLRRFADFLFIISLFFNLTFYFNVFFGNFNLIGIALYGFAYSFIVKLSSKEYIKSVWCRVGRSGVTWSGICSLQLRLHSVVKPYTTLLQLRLKNGSTLHSNSNKRKGIVFKIQI